MAANKKEGQKPSSQKGGSSGARPGDQGTTQKGKLVGSEKQSIQKAPQKGAERTDV